MGAAGTQGTAIHSLSLLMKESPAFDCWIQDIFCNKRKPPERKIFVVHLRIQITLYLKDIKTCYLVYFKTVSLILQGLPHFSLVKWGNDISIKLHKTHGWEVLK